MEPSLQYKELLCAVALCHPSSGNAGPTFTGSLPHAVPQPLVPCCPWYLAAPAPTPAVSPGPACSQQLLTAGSASVLPPGSAALPGPARSKRPRGTCSGHPGTAISTGTSDNSTGKETESL